MICLDFESLSCKVLEATYRRLFITVDAGFDFESACATIVLSLANVLSFMSMHPVVTSDVDKLQDSCPPTVRFAGP